MKVSEIPGYLSDDADRVLQHLCGDQIDLNASNWSPTNQTFHMLKAHLVYIASLENKPKIVDALLKAGVNPNVGIGMEGQEDYPLIIACKMGHEEVVSVLLTHNADTSVVNKRGFTALMTAYAVNAEGIISQLHAKNVSVNGIDKNGETPLTFACSNGLTAAVKLLITRGKSDIEQQNAKGHTPIKIALQKLHSSAFSSEDDKIHRAAVKALIAAGVDINKPVHENNVTPIAVLSSLGRDDILSLIAKQVAKRGISHCFLDEFVEQKTLMQLALISNQKSLGINQALCPSLNICSFDHTQRYLEMGASIIDTEYNTPWNQLLIACFKEDLTQVQQLLLTDIPDCEKDNRNCSPVEIAIFKGNAKLLEILRVSSAKIAACNNALAPLALAAYFGKINLLREYLREVQDAKTFFTAFVFACLNDHDVIAKLIIDSNKLVTDKASYQEALTLAASFGKIDCVHTLLRRYEYTYDKSSNALAYNIACVYKQEALALHLLRLKVAANKSYVEGDPTPLYVACRHGSIPLFEAIVSHIHEVSRDEKKECLEVAFRKRHFAVVSRLLTKQDLANKDYLGICLIKASALGDYVSVKFLLEQNAAINIIDKDGDTALHKAVKGSFIDISRILLMYGAAVDIKNVAKDSPKDIAYKQSDQVLYDMLSMASVYQRPRQLPAAPIADSSFSFWSSWVMPVISMVTPKPAAAEHISKP